MDAASGHIKVEFQTCFSAQETTEATKKLALCVFFATVALVGAVSNFIHHLLWNHNEKLCGKKHLYKFPDLFEVHGENDGKCVRNNHFYIFGYCNGATKSRLELGICWIYNFIRKSL